MTYNGQTTPPFPLPIHFVFDAKILVKFLTCVFATATLPLYLPFQFTAQFLLFTFHHFNLCGPVKVFFKVLIVYLVLLSLQS